MSPPPGAAGRTVALLRCSTFEQDTTHQRRAIEQWAAGRGITIAPDDWREEQGKSGAADDRPKLDEIVREATRGRVKRLVVFELERLGRTMPRIVNTVHALGQTGCFIVDVRRGLDTENEMGRAMIYVAGIFAEIERESLRRRTLSSLSGGVRCVKCGFRSSDPEKAEAHQQWCGGELRRVSVRNRQLGTRPDQWDEEADAELRRCIEEGLSLAKIVASKRITVQRPMRDKKTKEWTTRPVHPGRTKVQERIRELGLR